MSHALFVTWDGPETAYLEGLFFPLFAAMAALGTRVDVLQFTWGDAVPRRVEAASRYGVSYRAVRAPRGGAIGTAWVLARGPSAIQAEMRRSGAQILYPRSLLPLAVALRARRDHRLVFDADGLVADERIDFAGWRRDGPAVGWLRAIEARGIREADRVITRTMRAREILLARGGAGVPADRVVAIGNGKDIATFEPGTALERASFRSAHGVPVDAPWAIYCGSIGPQYHLDEMLAFHAVAAAIRPDARLTLLTRAPLAIDQAGVEVVAAPTDDIPRWLAAADLGLAWRTPTFSMAGVCPIKVAEYLLAGLPVLANTGVGDLDALLQPPETLLLPNLSARQIERAARWWLDDAIPNRDPLRVAARRAGVDLFGLAAVATATAAVLEGAMA